MHYKIRRLITRNPTFHKLAWNAVRIGNDRFYRKWEKEHDIDKMWEQLRMKKTSERCFIIGNGPSLNIKDLECLKKEDCFVSNKFYKIGDLIEWSPKYYAVQDRYGLNDEELNALDAECVLIGDYCWRKHNIKNAKAFCFHTYRVGDTGDIFFSENARERVVDAYTITYSMIQIAYTLGYTKIYLLGVDHSYPCMTDEKGRPSYNMGIKAHFYTDNVSSPYMVDVSAMTRAYQCAKEFADHNNFQIINATRGGKLDVFERVDFDSLF